MTHWLCKDFSTTEWLGNVTNIIQDSNVILKRKDLNNSNSKKTSSILCQRTKSV